jgi:hypothetical protein
MVLLIACMMEALACARFITVRMLPEKVYSNEHMVVFDFISISTI